ncbi:hypothetical protein BBO99_00002726 [Phytophthora kernoviae]|uniref:PX domain-containing protein n=2 Tax=Phytophthora kernoviae TaxID=325452 RepID=A0A3R7KM27_9STRA|nr:hypothetical protein G195_004184 [Phytophthora kernoviae 00238/432]KAG2526589.1 hypothetical protein JM16_003697 [Phytophthora kernoviae]KAG2528202.1 hypothetical protein JM18_003272 [Phytophthora kernoviae]RLN37165.1 hypothetical protein BBI17_004230 [Phytophthora kernoviae]RLN82677.1 hypothetical protein BBO99_00002726 [Phytophthora kernoviae]
MVEGAPPTSCLCGLGYRPHLSPVTLVPTRSSKAAAPLSFLEKIDRLEINHTIVRNDVVYYFLDIFLLHHTSRIPTHNMPTASDSQPDYQVEHRFSDFADLRYQAWAYAQRKHEDGHICKYCSKYMHFILYSLSQPRLYVKLSVGIERRKKVLKAFCDAFIGMALSSKTETQSCDAMCDGCQAIPHVVERFLRL